VFASSLLSSRSLLGVYFPRLVTVAGPAVAAMLVSASGAGVIRVDQLLRSCRISGRQAVLVILITAAGVALSGTAFVLAGAPAPSVFRLAADRASVLLVHLVVQTLVIGFGEEIGWRGWLLPSLAQRRTFGAAAGITGFVWAIWHGPVFLSGTSVALSFLVLIASLAVVLAWLWKRSAGSIALVAAAHGAANAPFVFLESFFRASPGGGVLVERAFLYHSVLYACVAFLLVIADRSVWSVTSKEAYAARQREQRDPTLRRSTRRGRPRR
jgi:membrane protease YdiL (CAAX protease family)